MNSEAYQKAKRLGEKACRQEGRSPYLPSLDAMGISMSVTEHVGIMEIPLSLIVGTKTVNRQNAFAANYMPLLEVNSEFAHKWEHVYAYQEENGISEPIVVYEYMHRFYVQEGNKRVSVLKYMQALSVEADVTRIMPKNLESEAGKRYQEFLRFFRVCPVYEIIFSHLGDYTAFAEALGQSFSNKWTMETVHFAEAIYCRFYMIFFRLGGGAFTHITAGDALLIYLRAYTAASIMDDLRAPLEERIKKLWRYFTQVNDGSTGVIQSEPEKTAKAIYPSFLRAGYSSARPLSVAFLYDGINDRFQEEGRLTMQETFGEKVVSCCFSGCSTEEKTQIALQKAIADGVEVIFTTSESMYKSAIRAATADPHIWILQASLTPIPVFLPTYACRLYEGMFLLGAVAAMKSDRLGYVEEPAVYGERVNINAFALGARYVNPRAQVLISATEAITLCRMENRRVLVDHTSSAHHEMMELCPDWGRYDSLLVKMVLERYHGAKAEAVQYWYGMQEGVVKLQTKEPLSEGLAKLYQDVSAGNLKLFGEVKVGDLIAMQDFVSNVGVK